MELLLIVVVIVGFLATWYVGRVRHCDKLAAIADTTLAINALRAEAAPLLKRIEEKVDTANWPRG